MTGQRKLVRTFHDTQRKVYMPKEEVGNSDTHQRLWTLEVFKRMRGVKTQRVSNHWLSGRLGPDKLGD